MATTQVRLCKHLLEKLRKIKDERGVTIAYMVNRAVENYLNQRGFGKGKKAVNK